VIRKKVMQEKVMLPTLNGPRIALRPITTDDILAYFALCADPAVTRYLSHPPYTDIAQAEEKVKKLIEWNSSGESFLWVIADKTDKQDNSLLGTCCVFELDHRNQNAELGYMLAQAHWGKGLAAEAVALMIDYVFTEQNLRRLEADADPRNLKSCALLERLGFVREGYLRERWVVAGEVSDTALYGLLKSDWELLKPLRPNNGGLVTSTTHYDEFPERPSVFAEGFPIIGAEGQH
jgi:[ribosomal protein S5]-alanine N-acetyltransferase